MQTLPRDNDGTLSAYAWPGGYPLYYLDNEHNILCPACANKEGSSTVPEAADVNYEDDALYCDDCNGQIACAYPQDA
jgi:hypothetical protein